MKHYPVTHYFVYKCIVIGLDDTIADMDVSDDEVWQPQCSFIQGLQKVWHIPSMQFVHIRISTTKRMMIKHVNTIAMAIADCFIYLITNSKTL